MSDDKQDPKSSRRAVALSYDGSRAPVISADAAGDLAEEIIALAREHGVPLFENPHLLALLQEVGLGEEIPEALYVSVAQIIAFVYEIQGKVPPGWGGDKPERWA